MKKVLRHNHRFYFSAYVIIGISLIVVLIGFTIYPNLKQNITHRPEVCLTGQLDAIKNEDFVNISTSGEDDHFYEQTIKALEHIKEKAKDYNLRGILYSGGMLQTKKPYYYFVSPSREEVITTDGNNILYSAKEPLSASKKILEPEQIKLLLPPLGAVEIAKPILNCHQDYPEKLRSEVNLYIDNNTDDVLWIVTVEDFHKSVPGPNVSHFVKINALTGEVISTN